MNRLGGIIIFGLVALFVTYALGNAPISSAGQLAPTGVQSVPVDPRGIYVDSNAFPLTAEKEAALSASLKVPGVDGLVLVLGWKFIEPAMGQYDWSTLDQWMGTAMSLGKKVDLSLRAGDLRPDWLFQPAPAGAGATPLTFSYPDKGSCQTETIPAPWDSAFLTQWDAMLAALSAHLKSTGVYNAVTVLRLTGVNRNTDELHLPAQTNQTMNGCPGDAITATWLQAGYRPSLLLQGWNGTTDSFKKYFPDKLFSVAIIAVTNPFPAIAEDGSVIKGMTPADLSSAQNLPLLTAASQKFPGHLVIQNNSLFVDEPAEPETVHFAQSLGTLLGFQTNEQATNGGGAACGGRGDSTPRCDHSTLRSSRRT